MKKKVVALITVVLATLMLLTACSDTVMSYKDAKSAYETAGFNVEGYPDMDNLPEDMQRELNVWLGEHMGDVTAFMIATKTDDDFVYIAFCTSETVAEAVAILLQEEVGGGAENYTGGTRLTVAAVGRGSAPELILNQNA